MKKLPLLLAALTISLSFAACKEIKNNNENTSSSLAEDSSASVSATEERTTLSSQRAEGVARDIEKGRFDSFSQYSDEEKELIKKSVEQDGYTMKYNSDGSATISNDEGSWFIGTGWAENEYTEGLPKVDFGTVTMSAQGEEQGKDFYIFLIKNAAAQQVADYIETLEEAGFSDSGDKIVDIQNGVISFIGTNSESKTVELGYTANGMTLKIY